jgi:hypothetical protein
MAGRDPAKSVEGVWTFRWISRSHRVGHADGNGLDMRLAKTWKSHGKACSKLLLNLNPSSKNESAKQDVQGFYRDSHLNSPPRPVRGRIE